MAFAYRSDIPLSRRCAPPSPARGEGEHRGTHMHPISRRCAPPSPTRGEGEHRDAHAQQLPGAGRHPLSQGEGRTWRCASTSISRRWAPPSAARGEGEHRDAHAHQFPGAGRHPLSQGEGRTWRCARTSISRRGAPRAPARASGRGNRIDPCGQRCDRGNTHHRRRYRRTSPGAAKRGHACARVEVLDGRVTTAELLEARVRALRGEAA